MADMPSGSQPVPGKFARAVSAQVRSAMSVHRVSGAELARRTGWSESYISKRLRDLSAWTTNDVEILCKVLGVDLLELLRAAAMASRRT